MNLRFDPSTILLYIAASVERYLRCHTSGCTSPIPRNEGMPELSSYRGSRACRQLDGAPPNSYVLPQHTNIIEVLSHAKNGYSRRPMGSYQRYTPRSGWSCWSHGAE